jgi:hypothetical protein
MEDPAAAPEWVAKDVLPKVQGHVRSVHMLSSKSALVFAQDHALVAEKGTIGGLKLYRVDYPPGFLVNGAQCPHCHQTILEPIGKVARLADGPKATPEARHEPSPRKKSKK